MEGNLRFKIDWASLIVGSKFTVFALFYFVFEGNFQVQAPPPRVLYLERRFNGGFFAFPVGGGGLIFGGAYTWRGLFWEFYGMPFYVCVCPYAYGYALVKTRLYPINPKTCDPILVTLLKTRPHYSRSSRENATPLGGTSPFASYKEVPPLPIVFDWQNF